MINLHVYTKFGVSSSTHHEDRKGDAEYRKCGGLAYLGGHLRSLEIAPFDSAMSSD